MKTEIKYTLVRLRTSVLHCLWSTYKLKLIQDRESKYIVHIKHQKGQKGDADAVKPDFKDVLIATHREWDETTGFKMEFI